MGIATTSTQKIEVRVSLNWNAISAAATVIQTLVVVTGVIIALWQLREALTERKMTAFIRLMDELERGSITQTRRFFATHQHEISKVVESGNLQVLDKFIKRKTRGYEELSMNRIQEDLYALEHVAMLCLYGMVPARLEQIYFTTIVASAWPNIECIVLLQRKKFGVVYLQHLEALYRLYTSGAVYQDSYNRARRQEAQRLLQASKEFVLKRRA